MSLVLDLIVVAVLALFLWRGASKGLVASLCGLLAFVVAFAGAGLAARTLSPMVADAISWRPLSPTPAPPSPRARTGICPLFWRPCGAWGSMRASSTP